MDAMTRGLLASGNHQIKVLTVATDKHPFQLDQIAIDYVKATEIEAVHLDTSLRKLDALSDLITGDSYNISRFYSIDFDRILIEVLRKRVFDLVIFESLFTAPYLRTIRKYCDGIALLRAHNIEHRIWHHLAKETRPLSKRIYLNWLADKLQEYEINAMHDFDCIAAISEDDKKNFEALGCSVPIQVLPFGLDTRELPPASQGPVNHVFHLGAMDWRPNIQGLKWFTSEIWPLVLKDIPSARLCLAGRNFQKNASWLKVPNVEVKGEVADAWDMMTSDGIMIIPLLSGSGMRIKAIEAMAGGRPIVSTSIGMEGIQGINREHYHIADTPEAFASCIVELLSNATEAEAMGKRSRQFVMDQFENQSLVKKMISAIQESQAL
jgi:glycosyltransferase involved in cell wall biosynthesis